MNIYRKDALSLLQTTLAGAVTSVGEVAGTIISNQVCGLDFVYILAGVIVVDFGIFAGAVFALGSAGVVRLG